MFSVDCTFNFAVSNVCSVERSIHSVDHSISLHCSVAVCQCGSVSVWQCGSVSVWQCGSVSVCQCGSVSVWQCVSVAFCISPVLSVAPVEERLGDSRLGLQPGRLSDEVQCSAVQCSAVLVQCYGASTFSSQRAACTVKCLACSVQLAVYSVQCNGLVYDVQYKSFSVQCNV